MPTVVLPNGVKINDVPEDYSQVDLLTLAANNGLMENDEAIGHLQAIQNTTSGPGWQDWIMENLELPGGILGALGGGAVGALGGPPGIAAGVVLGGAGGSGGGSLLSDKFTGNELDYEKAVDEAVWSLGIDLGTFGAGKILKPVIKRMFQSGVPVDQAAQKALEELRSTQQMLEAGGATLTPSQIRPTRFNEFKERLAQIGFASSGTMTENTQRVNQVIQENLNNLMQGTFDTVDTGRQMFDVIMAGKSALSDVYSQGLDRITPVAKGVTVTPLAFRNTIRKAQEDLTRRAIPEPGEALGEVIAMGGSSAERAFLSKWSAAFENNSRMTGSTLISIYKDMQRDISGMFKHGTAGYDPIAGQNLAVISDKLGNQIIQVLGRQNKGLAKDFRNLQRVYKEGRDGLLPTNIESLVAKGNDGSFSALGRAMAVSGNIDTIQGVFRSLDEAYAQMAKTGAKNPVAKEELVNNIRTGFLQTILPGVQGTADEVGDVVKRYQRMYLNMQKPVNAERAKAILGEQYEPFMGILRAIEHSSKIPKGSAGELLIQAKQYSTLATLLNKGGLSLFGGAGVGYAASAAGIPAAAVTAAVVFGTPVLLAKAATNPQVARKLLKLNPPKTWGDYRKQVYIINDVLQEFVQSDELTPAEKAMYELKRRQAISGQLSQGSMVD